MHLTDSPLFLELLLNCKLKFRARKKSTAESDFASVELHQMPMLPALANNPFSLRYPPGRALKPLSLVPLPPSAHPVVLFIFLPATGDPPREPARAIQSESPGIFQPFGARPLGSFTAYQL